MPRPLPPLITMATATLQADWRTRVEVVVQYDILGSSVVRV